MLMMTVCKPATEPANGLFTALHEHPSIFHGLCFMKQQEEGKHGMRMYVCLVMLSVLVEVECSLFRLDSFICPFVLFVFIYQRVLTLVDRKLELS